MTVSDVTGIIHELLPEPQSGLLAGMIFGIKSDLNEGLYEALIATGTLHIVALSGMNISILIAFTNALLLVVLNRPIANLVSCGIIIGFVGFVGPSPSIIRAAIMGFLSLLAVNVGRQYSVLLAWCITVIVMLAVQPALIADLSFQLSVMATLGIILFGAAPTGVYPASVAQKIRHTIEADLRVTLAAQAFTIPIILFAFGRISLVSPLSNLLIGWLIAPSMALGLVLVAVGSIVLPAAYPVAWIVWVPLSAIIWVIEFTGRLPFASVTL